ncbi:MAG: hypothetical protein WB760_07610 [Xanthobacteraceae bacterium]
MAQPTALSSGRAVNAQMTATFPRLFEAKLAIRLRMSPKRAPNRGPFLIARFIEWIPACRYSLLPEIWRHQSFASAGRALDE